MSRNGTWCRVNRHRCNDPKLARLTLAAQAVLTQVWAIANDEGSWLVGDDGEPLHCLVERRHLTPEAVWGELTRGPDATPEIVAALLEEVVAAGLLLLDGDDALVPNLGVYQRERARKWLYRLERAGREPPKASDCWPPSRAAASGRGRTRPDAAVGGGRGRLQDSTVQDSSRPPSGADRRRQPGGGDVGLGEGTAGKACESLPEQPPSEEALALADLLVDAVQARSRSPHGRRGVGEKRGAWAKELDLMLRNGALADPRALDEPVERGPIAADEIRSMLLWLKLEAPTGDDGFCWGQEIRSAKKLRQKWGKLERARSRGRPVAPPSPLARREPSSFDAASGEKSVRTFIESGLNPLSMGPRWREFVAARRASDLFWRPSGDSVLAELVKKHAHGYTIADLDAAVAPPPKETA